MAKEPVSEKKTCFKCGESKPLTEFYKHPKMADGRVNKCKECNKKDVQKNYRENIDNITKYERKRANLPHRVQAREDYAKTEQGLIAGNKAKKAWIGRNPEKRQAQIILGNAVRSGKIKKKPCEFCESTHRVHGHHDDYSKPLDVIWMCPQCHKDYHKSIKRRKKFIKNINGFIERIRTV